MHTLTQSKGASPKIEEIETIKCQLEAKPWNLDLYKRGIYLASIFKDTDSLNHLRASCIQYCVVDEAFWLAYIEDFKKESTEEQIIQLYEKAIKNEPCVAIWLSYLRHACGNYPQVYTRQYICELFEKSLAVLGLHALDGPQLWHEFRHFLTQQLDSNNDSDDITQIRNLFYRQLQLPLAGLADLLDEYLSWESELPKHLQANVSKGVELHKIGHDAWEKRKCFEFRTQSEYDEVVNPGNMSTVWSDYIDYERRFGDFQRVCIVYHRALDDLGYERDDLWINFCNFTRTRSLERAIDICERASRHMPKCVNIWINFMLLSVEANAEWNAIYDIYKRALLAQTDLTALVGLIIAAASLSSKIGRGDATNCRVGNDNIEQFRQLLQHGLELVTSRSNDPGDNKHVYRLLIFWLRRELKHITNVAAAAVSETSVKSKSKAEKGTCTFLSPLLDILLQLIQRNQCEAMCWLHVIDAVKALATACGTNLDEDSVTSTNVNGNELSNAVFEQTVSALSPVLDLQEPAVPLSLELPLSSEPNCQTPTPLPVPPLKKPSTWRKLISSLYETALKHASVGALAEEYIDFVQDSSFDDVKRAHLVVAQHTASTMNLSHGTGTLSLNNIILRRSRRRKSESYSETSSDSGSFSSRGGHRHLYLATAQGQQLGPSQSTPQQQHINVSPKLTVKELELATRATWDGCESADPSLAPAVPPPLAMPPPFSPIFSSRIPSSCASAQSGQTSTPDLSPDSKALAGATSTSGIHNPVTSGNSTNTNLPPPRVSPLLLPPPQDVDLFLPKIPNKGHFLLAKEHEAVVAWLQGGIETNTLWVSRIDASLASVESLTEIFSKYQGFAEARLLSNHGCCYVQYKTPELAAKALDAITSDMDAYTLETSSGKQRKFNVELSKPPRALFEEHVLFVRKIAGQQLILDQPTLSRILVGYFSSIGHPPKQIRTVAKNVVPLDAATSTSSAAVHHHIEDLSDPEETLCDYCYVEFAPEVNTREIIEVLLQQHGWPIEIKFGKISFQVAPSIPIIKKRTSPRSIASVSTSKNSGTSVATTGAAASSSMNTATCLGTSATRGEGTLERTIYITNLNFNTSNQELAKSLEANIGPVEAVVICTDAKSNKSKGYGYACFKAETDAMLAVHLETLEIGQRQVHMTKSKRPFPTGVTFAHLKKTKSSATAGTSTTATSRRPKKRLRL